MHDNYTVLLSFKPRFDRLFLYLNSFLFQPFYCRFAAVLGNNVFHHEPILFFFLVLVVHQIASQLTVIFISIQWRIWVYIMPAWSCGCETGPHHQPTSTVLGSWYEVFVLICCFVFHKPMCNGNVHNGQACPLWFIIIRVLRAVEMNL